MVDPTRIFREKRSKNEEKWLDLIPPFISPMIGGTQDRDEVGCQLTRLPQLAAPLCSIFSSISNFFFLIYYFNPSIVLCIFYTPSVLTTGLHPFPEWEYEEKLSLSSAGPSYLKNSFRWTVFCTGIWVFTIIYHFNFTPVGETVKSSSYLFLVGWADEKAIHNDGCPGHQVQFCVCSTIVWRPEKKEQWY